MATNSHYNFTTSPSSAFGKGDDDRDVNGSEPPVTPTRSHKLSGNTKSPLTPSTSYSQSESTNSPTPNIFSPNINGFGLSIGPLPPTPGPTPKTTSTNTRIPSNDNSSPTPAPLLSSSQNSPAPPPAFDLLSITTHASRSGNVTSVPDSAIFSTPNSVPNVTPSSTPAAVQSPLLRDRYDLNYDRTTSYPPHLNSLSEFIRTHYQTLEFYRKWTSHFISQLSGVPNLRNTMTIAPAIFNGTTTASTTSTTTSDPHFLPPRADHANEFEILICKKTLLKGWEIEVARAEMNALADVLLNRPLRHPWSSEDDKLLYRVHTSESKSPYSTTMGIRCSDWRSSLINDTPSERQRDGRAFQAHCNSTEDPSPYISVHTSVARLVKFLRSSHYDILPNSVVFVISLNRLKQLGIKATCTDEILDSFRPRYRKNGRKGFEDGVSYVTDSHWLVEQWVPHQAIVSKMECSVFLDIAESEGISSHVSAKNYKLDPNLEARKIELGKWSVGMSIPADGNVALEQLATRMTKMTVD
ncbi:hypothetical protein SBOR_9194 [Sclerotinia borealis F-4128]|uniref:DUF7587 domain-containing protein n=1 Tax=Sclerotinia borealis (strain F-4128) TaxID=1432307 RepID=W9C6A9_SCLBF|nr:hypothetical protein SBOR_9194 [Sclerotinia borealis F-4128]